VLSAAAPLYGAVEAGGTKFVLAVGTAGGEVVASHRLPTTTPAETLAAASAWFAAQPQLAAIGVGSFGPVDLAEGSPQWGHITRTPKPGWSDCDIAGHFARTCAVPIGFDTDVNAAALGEYLHGAGTAGEDLAYVTVGTGIGGGLVIGGRPVGKTIDSRMSSGPVPTAHTHFVPPASMPPKSTRAGSDADHGGAELAVAMRLRRRQARIGDERLEI